MNLRGIIRKHYGSQAEFARRAGVSPASVSLFLSGKYVSPELQERVERTVTQDFPGTDVSGLSSSRPDDAPAVLAQCISALELLQSRLDGVNRAYLDVIVEKLKNVEV